MCATTILTTTKPPKRSEEIKLLDPLRLPLEDLSILLDLGKCFLPSRIIVEFTRKRGHYCITAKHVHNLFDNIGYCCGYDAHQLVHMLGRKRGI